MEQPETRLDGKKRRTFYPFICPVCESIFWSPKCRKKKFCSRKCASENRRAPSDKATKRCSKCGGAKNKSEFRTNAARYDGLQGFCKECEDLNKAAWYRKNLEKAKKDRKASKETRRKEMMDYVGEYLKEHPCVDCGEKDIQVLDFDHVRGKKLGNVSNMLAGVRSFETMKKEIEKCEVRCANCHRRKTVKQLKTWRLHWTRSSNVERLAEDQRDGSSSLSESTIRA